jgi:lipopolysaccharide/colanic/teichoic acid biosynthesis glycosyltransferase
MVVLDLYYIQNASLLLDFRLLLKTIPVMILGIGAK